MNETGDAVVVGCVLNRLIGPRAGALRGRDWILFTIALSMLLAVIAPQSEAAEPKQVLLLHGFGHAYDPWSDVAQSFQSNLIRSTQDPIDIFEISIDSARIQTPDDAKPFIDYIRAIVFHRKPHLIVPVGAPAAFFAQRHRSQLFPTTPMLIAGAAERRISKESITAQDTAVLFDVDLRALIENVISVRRETRDLVVFVGNSPVERYWASELRREFEPLRDRTNVTWLESLTFAEMLEHAAKMQAESAILWIGFSEDVAGIPYSQSRALDEMRKVAAAPIFGSADYQLGRGIVGGRLLQTQRIGQAAAAVALRILNGESPASIELRKVAMGTPTYDWRELQRWGIREANLPPGSLVQFREPPVWRQYLWQSISVLAIVAAQALLIGGLLYQRYLRQQAELDVRHRAAELAVVNRRNLAGQLSASIAHEINQPLAAIVSSGNAGLRWLQGNTPDLDRVAASLKRIVQDGHRAAGIIETVRALFKKSDHDKVAIDINAAVNDVLDLMRSELDRQRVSVKSVQTQMLPQPLADAVQVQQVIVNLIRNAIDAMRAVTDRERTLKVRTEASEVGEVIIGIEDNGPGIEADNLSKIFEPFFTTKPEGMGMGLSICRSIIEAHGGTLTVSPGQKVGASFQIVLPANASLKS
jgi:signal transduction histidine kinase